MRGWCACKIGFRPTPEVVGASGAYDGLRFVGKKKLSPSVPLPLKPSSRRRPGSKFVAYHYRVRLLLITLPANMEAL